MPRCKGEQHEEVDWFEVYCPKVFACVGGLNGTLLSRCLVLHMDRAPRNHKRKSTRTRAISRLATSLVERLEAYATQNTKELCELYNQEPDEGYWPEISDREAELWGPLLIHARLIGKDAEQELLRVAAGFNNQKAEIQATDWHIAQTVDLLEAIQSYPSNTFTPGALVDALRKSEAWAYPFAKAKGHDEESVKFNRAVKVGRFLSKFRLSKIKDSDGNKSYDKKMVIDCLSAYVAQKPPYPPYPPYSNPPSSEVVDNKGFPEVTEVTEVGADQPGNTTPGTPESSVPKPAKGSSRSNGKADDDDFEEFIVE